MGRWEHYDTLTNREYEVLVLLVEAKRNSQIAQELGVQESTVEAHVHHVLSKLRVKSRAEAAVFAIRNGLVD